MFFLWTCPWADRYPSPHQSCQGTSICAKSDPAKPGVFWEMGGFRTCEIHKKLPLALLCSITVCILSTGSTASELVVIGEVGQDVTVPCRYSVRNGITSMCWGRDRCPKSKCSRPIIWTDGWKVTEQHSSRYQLKGDLWRGDVSLTIVDAREEDSGTYCCRVEIPGWFNDQLMNHKVVVMKGECRRVLLWVPSWWICSWVWTSKLVVEMVSAIIHKTDLEDLAHLLLVLPQLSCLWQCCYPSAVTAIKKDIMLSWSVLRDTEEFKRKGSIKYSSKALLLHLFHWKLCLIFPAWFYIKAQGCKIGIEKLFISSSFDF